MIEKAEQPDKPVLFAAKTAAIFAGILLGVYAIVTLLATMDRAQRPRLEEMRDVRPT